MQQQLAEPVRVFLCTSCAAGASRQQLHVELVEAGSSLANIMQLLHTRRVATQPFPTVGPPAGGGASSSDSSGILAGGVVVKRADGSCCSGVNVTEACSVHQLQAAIQRTDGCWPALLTFHQAPDGCLHATYTVTAGSDRSSSTSSSAHTHTVYARSTLPQPRMLPREPGDGCVPYADVVREQAVCP